MSNMSYCRFQNTAKDFRDCVDALEEGIPESTEERAALKSMLVDMLDVLQFIANERLQSVEELIQDIDDPSFKL